ncbi:hypothetical protein CCMA1212_000481, partial [Trichoderma ghanense]
VHHSTVLLTFPGFHCANPKPQAPSPNHIQHDPESKYWPAVGLTGLGLGTGDWGLGDWVRTMTVVTAAEGRGCESTRALEQGGEALPPFCYCGRQTASSSRRVGRRCKNKDKPHRFACPSVCTGALAVLLVMLTTVSWGPDRHWPRGWILQALRRLRSSDSAKRETQAIKK